MHICFVLPEYKSSHLGHSGGVGLLSATLANHLVRKGHDVTVVVGTSGKILPLNFMDENGVKVVAFYRYQALGLLALFVRLVRKVKLFSLMKPAQYFMEKTVRKRYSRIVEKVHNESSIDIIETSDSYGCMSEYLGKVPYVVRLHSSNSLLNSYSDSREWHAIHIFEKHCIAEASYLIAVSSAVLMDSCLHFGLSDIPAEVVYNGIDTECFSPEGIKKFGDVTRLIFLANLNNEKGIDVVCKIANQLAAEHVKYRIDIYGNGKKLWDSSFSQLLSTEALEFVTFHGVVRPEDVPSVLSNSDIFLCPSKYESFGLSVVEALSVGIPVIVNSFPAASEIVQNGITGFIVGRDKIDVWIEKIKLLSSDKSRYLKMSLAAMKNVRLKFTDSKMVDQTLLLYHKVLQS